MRAFYHAKLRPLIVDLAFETRARFIGRALFALQVPLHLAVAGRHVRDNFRRGISVGGAVLDRSDGAVIVRRA